MEGFFLYICIPSKVRLGECVTRGWVSARGWVSVREVRAAPYMITKIRRWVIKIGHSEVTDH